MKAVNKFSLIAMKRHKSISPPPLKRRKSSVDTTGNDTQNNQRLAPRLPLIPSPKRNPETIRIFSWNINGIDKFVGDWRASAGNQKSIKSFFTPKPDSKTKGLRNGDRDDRKDDNRSGDEGEEEKARSNLSGTNNSLREFLKRHGWPEIVMLQEVKVAPSDTTTQDLVRRAVNTPLPSEKAAPSSNRKTRNSSTKNDIGAEQENLLELPQYEVHFTLPTDNFNARGLRGTQKVHGVATLIRSDISTSSNISVNTVEWDKEGRVQILTLPSLHIAILNIYAVNGTDSPYRDPQNGNFIGTRHTRKREFHSLLARGGRRLEGEGWKVLMGGDMNVAPAPVDGWPKLRTFPYEHVVNRRNFHAKLLSGMREKRDPVSDEEGSMFEGVDVWRKMNPEERRFTWFSRTKPWGASCDRVDYFIAGRRGWDGREGMEEGWVKGCGILDCEEERGASDHCPIWCEVWREGGSG